MWSYDVRDSPGDATRSESFSLFSLHIRGHLYPAVEALLERLSSRREEMAEDMLATLRRDVAAYAAAEGEELGALRVHCSDHVDAFLATTRTGRVPTGRAVEFVQKVGARGARDGVELEVLLRG